MTFRKYLFAFLAILFWIGIWELVATSVDIAFVLPRVGDTLRALLALLCDGSFWWTVCRSVYHILLGLLLGVLAGSLLSLLAVCVPVADAVISPFMVVVRATPVASFVLILWVLIGRDSVPQAIALLMVTPIVFQNLSQGLRSLDRRQGELLRAFGVPPLRSLGIYVLPSLLKYMVPAFITSAGLAWKSGIAAEIIAYTKDSIGRAIVDAKTVLQGDVMIAWTIVVILLSFGVEASLKLLGRRLLRHHDT